MDLDHHQQPELNNVHTDPQTRAAFSIYSPFVWGGWKIFLTAPLMIPTTTKRPQSDIRQTEKASLHLSVISVLLDLVQPTMIKHQTLMNFMHSLQSTQLQPASDSGTQ